MLSRQVEVFIALYLSRMTVKMPQVLVWGFQINFSRQPNLRILQGMRVDRIYGVRIKFQRVERREHLVRQESSLRFYNWT